MKFVYATWTESIRPDVNLSTNRAAIASTSAKRRHITRLSVPLRERMPV
jgi:hypothetical protein